MQEIASGPRARPSSSTSRGRCRRRSADANGAEAALVYVPHTTAGVTINEGADPTRRPRISRTRFSRSSTSDWEWKHVEDPDGPNAPSHVRASLVDTQVLVPLEGGKLALGT